MGIGEAAGLTSAGLWALASLMYSRARMTAWELNFWKNILASVVFLIHLWLVKSLVMKSAVFEAPLEAWCWLTASSIVGIVVGDTVYFRSLQILGPRRALVVATASPIFGVILGFFVMGNVITLILVLGVGLTVLGVAVAVGDKRAVVENPNVYPGLFYEGILFGLGGAFCQAFAIALAQIGMAHGCEALESSFIRIFTAALASIGLVIVYPERFLSSYSHCPPAKKLGLSPPDEPGSEDEKKAGKPGAEEDLETPPNLESQEENSEFRSIFSPLKDRQAMKCFLPAALIGTWLGIWMFQVAQQYTVISVVTTMASTCPIFAIPLVWIFHGHRISRIGILGTMIAVLGVILVVNR